MTHYNAKGEVTHYNSLKKRCPNNHEYDNVDSRGYRVCMTCKLDKQKEARRKNALVRRAMAERGTTGGGV